MRRANSQLVNSVINTQLTAHNKKIVDEENDDDDDEDYDEEREENDNMSDEEYDKSKKKGTKTQNELINRLTTWDRDNGEIDQIDDRRTITTNNDAPLSIGTIKTPPTTHQSPHILAQLKSKDLKQLHDQIINIIAPSYNPVASFAQLLVGHKFHLIYQTDGSQSPLNKFIVTLPSLTENDKIIGTFNSGLLSTPTLETLNPQVSSLKKIVDTLNSTKISIDDKSDEYTSILKDIKEYLGAKIKKLLQETEFLRDDAEVQRDTFLSLLTKWNDDEDNETTETSMGTMAISKSINKYKYINNGNWKDQNKGRILGIVFFQPPFYELMRSIVSKINSTCLQHDMNMVYTLHELITHETLRTDFATLIRVYYSSIPQTAIDSKLADGHSNLDSTYGNTYNKIYVNQNKTSFNITSDNSQIGGALNQFLQYTRDDKGNIIPRRMVQNKTIILQHQQQYLPSNNISLSYDNTKSPSAYQRVTNHKTNNNAPDRVSDVAFYRSLGPGRAPSAAKTWRKYRL